MRVEIHKIPDNEEPYVRVHVQKETKDIRRLADYIETEQYRGVRIECNDGNKQCYVDSRNIFYVESLADVLYLHTSEGILESRKRLYEMEDLLPREFVRVSKSAIMNLTQVRTYKPLSNGLMLGEFINGDAVYISRRYARKLKKRLKEG